MRRVAIAVGVAVIVAGAMIVGHAGQDPFFDTSDTGQRVHVLPTPAAVHRANDPVPVFAPVTGKTAVYPPSYGSGNLINHGGNEIGSAAFQAIYWNKYVSDSTATSLNYATIKAEIDAFIASFPDGTNWDNSATDDYTVIQQYGSTTSIAPTLTKYNYFVDTQPTQKNISDSKIQSYLTNLFNNGTGGITPSPNVIYGIYFPPGMKIMMSGGSSCSTFCGYHNHFSYGTAGIQIKYAVFPYLSCTACKISSLSVADMLTIVSSHEIREAVTDADGSAWYDNARYEADDKCAWHNLYQMNNGGFWVQPEYSNGGTVAASGFTASYPGAGCVVPK